jgi:PadR family transcriptional regulator PadR
MATPIRLSRRSLAVLRAVLSCGGEADALDIAKSAQRWPARTYPVLARFEDMGWIDSRWDTSGAHPRRRLYRVTAFGRESAQRILDARTGARLPAFLSGLRGAR